MSDKKTFTAERIKTDEICGITGGPVTICGIDNVNLTNISGQNISGTNLIVSGDGNSLADFKSGVFDEIMIGGVRYVPRNQIAYAFRFGGPPVNVPSRGPTTVTTGSGSASEQFTDSSSSSHSVSGKLGATHSTSQAEFGATSILVDGFDDYLIIPDSDDFAFGTGNFTIEFWFYPLTAANGSALYQMLLSKGAAGTDAAADFEITFNDDQKIDVYRLQDDNFNAAAGTTVLALNQWHHVAVVREGTGTGQMKLYINGALETTSWGTSWTKTNAVYNSTRSLFIGAQAYTVGGGGAPNVSNYFQGYMEEIRLSTTARYSSNFTPHTTSFANDSNTVLLIQSPASGSSGGDTYYDYSGLTSGTNLVYVEDGSSFATGDHVLVGGLSNPSETQESHTITGITYYNPTDCCNAVAESDINASQVGGANRIYYHQERQSIKLGNYIRITGSSQAYKVTNEYSAGGGQTSYVDVTPNLNANVASGDCICITPATLHTQSNLANDFITGTKVANKFARTITESGCTSGCYDSQYLYLEKAMYKNQTFDWNLTGYRESYIGFSGIEFNITGNNTTGLFTMVYPDI